MVPILAISLHFHRPASQLAHWAHYLFPWPSSAHLSHLYLLFFLWTSWLLFLLCWLIGLSISFPMLPWSSYFIFTSYSSHGPIGCYSYHVVPLGFLPLFLGFLSPLTSFLPIILSTSLLAVIPTMLTQLACYLFSWASSALLLHLYLLFFQWTCWLLFLPCRVIGFTNLLYYSYFIFFPFPLLLGVFY